VLPERQASQGAGQRDVIGPPVQGGRLFLALPPEHLACSAQCNGLALASYKLAGTKRNTEFAASARTLSGP